MDQWANCCRSCLRKAESFSHFIYQHISPEEYFFCASIEVKQDDELPKALCEECFTLINKFIQFKTRCTQSESKLFSFSSSLLHKEEPYSKMEEESNLDLHETWKNEKHAIEEYSDLKTELEENEVETELGNYTDEITVKKQIYLDDTEEHVDETKISSVNIVKSTKKKLKLRNSLPKNHKCEQCNTAFTNKKSLERHLRMHERKTASTDSRVCKTCNKTCSSNTRLQTHVKAMHTKYPFKDVTCQVCSKVCKSPVSLKGHMKTHEEIKRQICHECGMVLKSGVTFKNHLKTHVKNRERNFTCEHCGKQYISKNARAIHVYRRHTTKQFICNYCQYVCTEKAYLARHIMLHEGTHPKYKCNICSRSLASKVSLRLHKRIHTGEKPYTCKHCSKSFSLRSYLVNHERSHTGEKPFQCSVCALQFSTRSSMKRHMNVHNKKVVGRIIEGV